MYRQSLQSRKLKVALIGEDPVQRRMLGLLLRKEGLAVRGFECAEDALGAIVTDDPVDLVVTDLCLPGIGGWRLCRLLRSPGFEPFHSIPIVVISSAISGENAEDIADRLGANVCLGSPVNGPGFIVTVRALLKNRPTVAMPRLLIVDGSRPFTAGLKRAFEGRGYEVTVAASGQQAIESFMPNPHDLVLLAQDLPDMSGEDLLLKLRWLNPETFFIILTPDQASAAATEWLKKGASSYARRRAGPQALIHLCETVWREHATASELPPIGEILLGVESNVLELHQAPSLAGDGNGSVFRLTDRSINATAPLALVGQICSVARKLRLSPATGDGPKQTAGVANDPAQSAHAAQPERQKLEEQLQQSRKLQAIGQLTGGVAHDLNNMLSPILGYGEMLFEDLPADTPHKEHARRIVQAAERARDLVHQLLAFARKQASEKKPLDLNHIVSEFERMLRRTVRETVAIQVRTAPSVGTILGDAGQIEQIILNLALNAQDAMPGGGRLVIETKSVTVGPASDVHCDHVKPGAYALLTVSDTGVGMDAKTVDRIFEPFFTTKMPGLGTGLGLATVEGIVRRHGGAIRVTSEPGKGSSFRVYFPREDCPVASEPASASVIPVRGTETVLVVEDHEPMRNLACDALKSQGYSVVSAASGEEAIGLAADRRNPIDLVLTDIVMPDMDGRELCRRLGSIRPNIKVLYMSGYTDDVIGLEGTLNAHSHLIRKPFSVSSLTQKMREVLDA